MSDPLMKLLLDLKVIDADSLKVIHNRVRDRDDIYVYQCQRSNVIFLSRSDHISSSYYEEVSSSEYWSQQDRSSIISACSEDIERRAHQFKTVVANKIWADIGAGSGGILEQLSPYAQQTYAVEPQASARSSLCELGFSAFESIEDIPENNLQVVTLFHVFEHFVDPMEMLKDIKFKMESSGKIIIEVPHAKDFLISFLENDAFKSNTFWSEHLILHTRESLRIFLEKAGFVNISISGVQRYPLANHLHWMANAKPGGHRIWDSLRTVDLDKEYEKMLSKLDFNDTLIATAFKP